MSRQEGLPIAMWLSAVSSPSSVAVPESDLQDSCELWFVELPPWAGGSPDTFVRPCDLEFTLSST